MKGVGGGSTLPAATLFVPPRSGPGPDIAFTDTPRWFEDAPALFCPSPRSAGCVLLSYEDAAKFALSRQITSFDQLPTLLQQARSLGTDLLYLVDWYEGEPGADPSVYLWNKGDYVPRADLGGARGLKQAIEAVHRAGGRVMSYFEPFVIHKASTIGKAKGQAWSIKTATGYPEEPYPDDWKICPACGPARDHLVACARRIVGELGFDALHLDSAGFEHGWACVESAHGHAIGQASVFDDGMVALVRAVHAAVREANPEAVLMCEGPTVPRMFGEVSASEDWGVHTLVNRWVWDRAGRTSVFTAGWSLDDVHQILALGHKLSLGGRHWLDQPPGRSASAWLDANVPSPLPQRGSDALRRYLVDPWMRVVHQWRNGAILAGIAVPSIDAATPRRWDNPEDYRTPAGVERAVANLRAAARELDAAIGGSQEARRAATDHVATLATARRALQPLIRGTTPRSIPTARADAAAYAFEGGRKGGALTAVNVGNEAVTLDLPASGEARDLATGETFPSRGGRASVRVPPHGLRLMSVG